MLELTGYFDASGTHDGSNNVTLAGWVSTPEAWARFETEWQAELANLGVPMFHMREYAHHRGVFEKWSEPQRRIRFGRLAKVITDHTVASIAVCVPAKEFDEEFTPAARGHAGGAYGFAARVLFMQAPAFVEESLNPKGTEFTLSYVFESGDKGRGQVAKLYKANKMDPPQVEKWHLGSLSFEDKRRFGALQAADILAYELYQHFPRQLGQDPREPRRYNLRQLAANRSWDWRYLSRERMRADWAMVIDMAARIADVEPWPRKRLPDDWSFPTEATASKATLNLAIRPAKKRKGSQRGH
ncbi:MAG: hypothetical protein ABI725_02315 [Chloroflexota bacterium]